MQNLFIHEYNFDKQLKRMLILYRSITTKCNIVGEENEQKYEQRRNKVFKGKLQYDPA